jgi:hypothetical protein
LTTKTRKINQKLLAPTNKLRDVVRHSFTDKGRTTTMSAIDPQLACFARTEHLRRDVIPGAFSSVEDAWFWTLSALAARREGARSSGSKVSRPCEPDDVLRCLDVLYRNRRIDLTHARIMRIWGERRCAPDPRRVHEKGDWRVWREAMDRLGASLRAKGIVA